MCERGTARTGLQGPAQCRWGCMLLWVSLLGGLALILAISGLTLSMSRAERRARRTLYRSLGLAETTVEFLMERNRDVLTELTYLRHEGEAAVRPAPEAAAQRGRNVVFLRPGGGSALPTPALSDEGENPALDVGRDAPPSDGATRH